jgi:putative membrane protein insertion efficiency factor
MIAFLRSTRDRLAPLSVGTQILVGLVLLYRWCLAPCLGPVCRFSPTCSTYALAALQKYGALQGSKLTLLRLAKCHPWHPGGYDPLH